MQNVLKRKNLYLEGSKVFFEFYPSKPKVLDHFESIDMHLEKIINKHLIFCRTGGEGQKVTDMFATIIFFYAFLKKGVPSL